MNILFAKIEIVRLDNMGDFCITNIKSLKNRELYQHKKENNIMFRTIRKKKNEISIDTAKALLQSSRRGVLAVNGDDGYPYAIPINYVYDDDAQKIYFQDRKSTRLNSSH